MNELTDEQVVKSTLKCHLPKSIFAEYNPKAVEAIDMIRSKEDLTSLSIDELSYYMIVLGQYLIHLDNIRAIASITSKNIEEELDMEIAKICFANKIKGTVVEKTVKALELDSNLIEMKNRKDEAIATFAILDTHGKAVLEYLNTLKKIYEKMLLEYQNHYRTS